MSCSKKSIHAITIDGDNPCWYSTGRRPEIIVTNIVTLANGEKTIATVLNKYEMSSAERV